MAASQITREVLIPLLKNACNAFEQGSENACELTKSLYEQHYSTLAGFVQTNPNLKKSQTYKASLGVAGRGKKLKCPDKKTRDVLFGFVLCIYQASLGVDDNTMRNTAKQASSEGVDKPHKNQGDFLLWLVKDMEKKLV